MPPVIDLKTAIPGPKSQALNARRAKAVPRGVPSTTPLAVVHAENAVVTDADGNRLIDFGGGIGVVNAGHRNPRVVEAVRQQLDHFTHVCFRSPPTSLTWSWPEKLNALTPGGHEKRTFFVNSGAGGGGERREGGPPFHRPPGDCLFRARLPWATYLAMALTSKVMPYKKGFGPFAPEVYRMPFPYCYQSVQGGQGGKGWR
jgi:4-aminobutyrate aminotransferase/(S)-3-amino-2-methylpropionate transaminase